MTRGDIAKNYFLSGYNCAQAVVLSFSDITGLDEKTAVMLTQPFGGGMGAMREVCGTFSGMLTVLGLVFGDSDPKNVGKRKELYARVQELAKKFEEDNGSIVCRELLGMVPMGSSKNNPKQMPPDYKKRPCPELAKYATDLLDEYIKNAR